MCVCVCVCVLCIVYCVCIARRRTVERKARRVWPVVGEQRPFDPRAPLADVVEHARKHSVERAVGGRGVIPLMPVARTPRGTARPSRAAWHLSRSTVMVVVIRRRSRYFANLEGSTRSERITGAFSHLRSPQP
jgi:hypothetical protein